MADELNVSMSQNFIHDFIDEDIAQGGQYQGMTVHTRFPPEPNGYLHIGHCKALTIDFGTAEKYGGLCNLRMDDTNPTKEDAEYVDAIQEDIHWLGFDWGDRFYYASDYFEKMYEYAVELIQKGLAYVCQLTPEEFKENRGDYRRTRPLPLPGPAHRGVPGPLPRMRAGEFPDGLHDPAGQDRPGQRQLQHARPGDLPHQPRPPPPPGGQVVHLPHVRLRPPPRGRAGGHHPLPVLPGV